MTTFIRNFLKSFLLKHIKILFFFPLKHILPFCSHMHLWPRELISDFSSFLQKLLPIAQSLPVFSSIARSVSTQDLLSASLKHHCSCRFLGSQRFIFPEKLCSFTPEADSEIPPNFPASCQPSMTNLKMNLLKKKKKG